MWMRYVEILALGTQTRPRRKYSTLNYLGSQILALKPGRYYYSYYLMEEVLAVMVFKWIKANIIGETQEPPTRQPQMQEPWQDRKTRVFSTRDFALGIVGESNYQDALRRSKDSVKDYAGSSYVTAVLVREPDNQYDPGAVKVMNGQLETIGYLHRALAREYGPAIERWESEGYLIRCQAVYIYGDISTMAYKVLSLTLAFRECA